MNKIKKQINTLLSKKKYNKKNKKHINAHDHKKGQKPENRMYMIVEDIEDVNK